jgi:hypothetical protein
VGFSGFVRSIVLMTSKDLMPKVSDLERRSAMLSLPYLIQESPLDYYPGGDVTRSAKMPAKTQRQANIGAFFSKVNATKTSPEVKSLRESPEPPSKRRKVGSSSPRDLPTSLKDETLSTSENFLPNADYPPPDHPSYHPPPGPTYNHPIVIPRVPDSLLSSLKFNTKPKLIVKPELGLDLQYFKPFIDPSCSAQLTQYLLESLPWYRVKYTVRGIDINTPRYTTVFGKDATSTPWTGYDKAEPRAIPRILLKLMQQGKEDTYRQW